MAITNGSKVDLHTKVNIDPLGSHCSLCGGRTKKPLWFPLSWDGTIDVVNADPTDFFSEAIFGWWPVGSECAKEFADGVLVKR